jgi:8-oxo-dGTP diphosphatase
MSRAVCSVDLVCCSVQGRRLRVLAGATHRGLPWSPLSSGAEPLESASELARTLLGSTPSWMSQLAAYGGRHPHPSGAALSVAYATVIPWGVAPAGWEWVPADGRGATERQRQMVVDAVDCLRTRVHVEPIAFRLLPERFTLSELQAVYEVLLGRRLHKASFRRALHASGATVAMQEWRSEARGRPAQLHRQAPRRRPTKSRPVRLDVLEY